MRSLLYLDLSMLTVQVSQQHPLVALHLNKVNSFSAVTVHTTAAENVGPESRRVGRHKGHTRVIKSGDDGEVKVCWERSTHYVGQRRHEPGIQLEVSDGDSARQRRTTARNTRPPERGPG